ncbi:MAG: class I SAM-dependent methyltransferase [Candidatus Binataceae bacterium]
MESCVFCGSRALRDAFARQGRSFVRCVDCRAYMQTQREVTLQDVYESGTFVQRIEEGAGNVPMVARFDEFVPMLNKGGSLLEIGSGTGHLLAAARLRGFAVIGIETSPFHREYIRKTWGIETIGARLETAPLAANSIDNVVSTNVFEHITKPLEHLKAVFRVLRPGGRCLISTANADCIVASLCGRYWTMFKPPDHLSIPSPKSLRVAGESAGLSVLRLWCSEYPLETPLGLAVAMRDWVLEHRQPTQRTAALGNPNITINSKGRMLVKARAFGFVASIFSAMMRAASVKVLFEKPGFER